MDSMHIPEHLISKYNKAIPRYTSYPTVPHWQATAPTEAQWISHLNHSMRENPEISLYIHLPYCENLCTYCGCNKRITKNHAVESPYIDALLTEWSLYLSQLNVRPVLKEMHLGGGTPTFFSPSQLKRLISAIRESVELADDYSFSFEAHPNSTTTEHLGTLFTLGFNRISIGVQDVSPEILKAINRYQTEEQVARVTTEARSIGYTSINYDIIYGLPFQTVYHIEATMQFISRMMPDRIAFYSYAHVPWKSKAQRAFTDQDVPYGNEKQKLKESGEAALESLGYYAIGMDHFALRTDSLFLAYQEGKMHRNFMGYTDQYTRCMIGLGASSISDCWSMFIQNEKKIEDYQKCINAGLIPICSGHELTDEEMLTRQKMLDLICRDQLTWSKGSTTESIIYENYDELIDMCTDGLITMHENQIRLTPLGQKFIRNICATIDPKLKSEAETVRFSQAI